mmetsp:Transcript_20111/g.31069  ORF Transcript_20111/g.31069 Transcript_20111/m.31069 type:complete len:394 (+) Transcript_20111:127-1308(+)
MISPATTMTKQEQQEKEQQHKGRRTFPMLLHDMLTKAEQEGFTDICSWQPHGRAFRIHKHKQFTEKIMPQLFRQSKWSSFQRQLNLYGFNRFTANNPDKGAYYHEAFLRGNPLLVKRIERKRVKGTKRRVASNPELNPDFYTMPSLQEDNNNNNNNVMSSSSSSSSSITSLDVVASSSSSAASNGRSRLTTSPIMTQTQHPQRPFAVMGQHQEQQQYQQYPPYYPEFAPPTELTMVASHENTPVITPTITPRASMDHVSYQHPPRQYHHLPTTPKQQHPEVVALEQQEPQELESVLSSSSYTAQAQLQEPQLGDLCEELDNIFADDTPLSGLDFNNSLRSLNSTISTQKKRKSCTAGEIDFILNNQDFDFDLMDAPKNTPNTATTYDLMSCAV